MTNKTYKRVMIIDDDKLYRYTSEKFILNSEFADEVMVRHDASEVPGELLTLLATPEALPEVILLDIHMPVMDGFAFLDQYEKLPSEIQDNCCIVMISSTESPEDLARIKTYPSIRMFRNKPLTDITLNDIKQNLPLKLVAQTV